MKLFDCHCHIHLGPRGLAPLLETIPPIQPLTSPLSVVEIGDGVVDGDGASQEVIQDYHPSLFAGAAIMSTHPRDYSRVDSIVSKLRERSYKAVACYGVHPWFLHEVLKPTLDEYKEDNELSAPNNNSMRDADWLLELKQRLITNPDAILGEIGLDGARWRELLDDEEAIDETNVVVGGAEDKPKATEQEVSIWKRKRVLSCPMNLQRRAFEQQLLLAAELQRPVSIHVVRAWGELFDSFDHVRDAMRQKYYLMEENVQHHGHGDDDYKNRDDVARRRRKELNKRLLLPPKIYFHAFSGKAGILPSLLAACEKGNVPRDDVFFGFPPVIPNFSAPKTPSIMKQIGIRQLVLETDLEDATNCWNDLNVGVEVIAEVFDMDVNDVAEQMHSNAERLYFAT